MSARGRVVEVDAGELAEVPVALLERAARHTLAAAGPDDVQISVAVLDDEAIRALNREYLDADRPTDVLAFALGGEGDLVGDVYVGLGQARRQAAELGIPLAEELVRLVVHGTLHVLGHDHPEGSGREESAMFALQERLVQEIVAGDM